MSLVNSTSRTWGNVAEQHQPFVRLEPTLQLGKAAAIQFRAVAERTSDIGRAGALLALADRLDRLAPHMLRHSLARRLLHRGAHLPEVQRILGHRRLSTTGRYLTPSDADLRAAIDRCDPRESLSVAKKTR